MRSGTISWFWPVLFASFGGIIVLVGVLLEVLSEKNSFKNLENFRKWERARHIGGWLVVVGVLAEVINGGVAAINEWRNDPRRQVISTITASVKLTLHNANVLPINPMDSTTLDFGKASETKSNIWKMHLEIKSSIGANNKMLEFGMPLHIPRWNLSESDTVESADTWDVVSLAALFIPKESEVDGEATVFFNNEMRRYRIPLQRAHFVSNPTGIKDSSGAVGVQVIPNPF